MNESKQLRLILVSGLSGAGKSVVLNTLEDLNFYSIDNLPISLLDQLIKSLVDSPYEFPPQVAIGIDARNPASDLTRLKERVDMLKDNGVMTEIVFMEASNDVLTKRYSETRRRHPLSSATLSLSEAIDKEKSILSELSEFADLKIDTSYTAVHELRKLVHEQIVKRAIAVLSMQFISFGYKHGLPLGADFVFDIRCLPNPHWVKELRKYSGKDRPVIKYLEDQPDVLEMLDQIKTFLERWVPQFEKENRSYLTIAVGCTGGHHRSVFMIENLAEHFRKLAKHVFVRHRDL